MAISITTVENITRQTDKAIQFDAGDRLVWVPKSITSIDDNGVVFAAAWWCRKNGIGPQFASRVLVG